MNDAVTFRPRSGPFFAGVVIISAMIYTYQSFAYFSFATGMTTVLWSALLAIVVTITFVRPKVIIFDEGLTIINPLYTITIPWSEVIAIDVRYTMSIRVREPVSLPFHRGETETIYAFAAPAPGRYHSRTIHPTEMRGVGISHELALRPGDSPRSHSGQAAAIARLRLQRFEREISPRTIASSFQRNSTAISAVAILVLLICIDIIL